MVTHQPGYVSAWSRRVVLCLLLSATQFPETARRLGYDFALRRPFDESRWRLVSCPSAWGARACDSVCEVVGGSVGELAGMKKGRD